VDSFLFVPRFYFTHQINLMLLTDDQWNLILEKVPALLGGTNMRNSSPTRERLILECILWKFAAGVPWYDLPDAYPFVTKDPATGAFDPPLSYQTIYRRCRAWRKSGLLSRVVSTLTADLQTRGGFDISEALSTGLVQLDLNHRKKLKVTIAPGQKTTWQLLTALLLISIAARQI
jgi:transposase